MRKVVRVVLGFKDEAVVRRDRQRDRVVDGRRREDAHRSFAVLERTNDVC